MPKPALNAKQKLFISEYLKDRNATQAAIRAGYSKKTAKYIGWEALRKPHVAAAIEAAEKKLAERNDVTQDRIIAEFARIGFANMQDYMTIDNDGQPSLDWSALTREQAAALQEVTVDTIQHVKGPDVQRVKFKLADKLNALAKLGVHLGMFKETVRVEVSYEELLGAARKAAGKG